MSSLSKITSARFKDVIQILLSPSHGKTYFKRSDENLQRESKCSMDSGSSWRKVQSEELTYRRIVDCISKCDGMLIPQIVLSVKRNQNPSSIYSPSVNFHLTSWNVFCRGLETMKTLWHSQRNEPLLLWQSAFWWQLLNALLEHSLISAQKQWFLRLCSPHIYCILFN